MTEASSKYSIAYGSVEGGDDPGQIAYGEGFYAWAYKKNGRIALRFQERTETAGLQSVPAVVVTPHGAAQQLTRLEDMRSKENADRRIGARVDNYTWDSKDDPRTTDPHNAATGFHVLALASAAANAGDTNGTATPRDCGLPATDSNTSVLANETSVQIAAAIVDTAANKALVAYGCTLGSASAGRVTLNFSPAFTSAPALAATIEINGTDRDKTILSVGVESASKDSATLVFGDGTADAKRVLTDGRLHVVAMGPGTAPSSVHLAYGVVNRDGGKYAGAGFTTGSPPKKGLYPITFDPPFLQDPVIVGSGEHVDEDHVRQVTVQRIEENPETPNNLRSNVRIATIGRQLSKRALGPNDCRFHFIAYAPT